MKRLTQGKFWGEIRRPEISVCGVLNPCPNNRARFLSLTFGEFTWLTPLVGNSPLPGTRTTPKTIYQFLELLFVCRGQIFLHGLGIDIKEVDHISR